MVRPAPAAILGGRSGTLSAGGFATAVAAKS